MRLNGVIQFKCKDAMGGIDRWGFLATSILQWKLNIF
jgi:hypothetical protein